MSLLENYGRAPQGDQECTACNLLHKIALEEVYLDLHQDTSTTVLHHQLSKKLKIEKVNLKKNANLRSHKFNLTSGRYKIIFNLHLTCAILMGFFTKGVSHHSLK